MNLQVRSTAAVVASMLLMPGSPSSARADRDVTATVRFNTPPVAPLPDDIRSIKVLKPNYLNRSRESGIMGNAEMRWYQVFIGGVQTAIASSGSGVVLEHEDQIAGDYEQKARRVLDDEDPEAPRHAGGPQRRYADATITVRFWVDTRMERIVTERKWTSRLADELPGRLPVVGRLLPHGHHGPDVQYRQVVTMQCDMALTSCRTQRQLAKYSRSLVYHRSTHPDIALGFGGTNLTDLGPPEEAIQELVNEHCENFVSLFLPIFRTRTIALGGVREALAQAVDRINSGDLDGGAMGAWAVWQAKRRKDDKAAAVLGVYWETKGELGEARLYYNAACALSPQNSEYKRAVQRVTDLAPATPGVAGPARTAQIPAKQIGLR